MAEETLPHSLTLRECRELTVSGVSEVVAFGEDMAVLNTAQGTLTVQGQQLQLKELLSRGGQVSVTGQIQALGYAQRRAGGWLSRLLE